MAHQKRIAGTAVLAAAASLALTPAQAQAAQSAPVGTLGYATSVHAALGNPEVFGSSAYDSGSQVSEWRRGWGWRGRRGWRRGWRGRRGIRGGDILAGALVIGGIAAIASAANNNRRRDRDVVIVERERVVPDNDRDYDYRPERRVDNRVDNGAVTGRRNTNRSTTGGSGIENAVSQCLNAVEQDVRVDSVDGASRVAQGWVVSGTLFDGDGFSCQIDNSGRISNIDYGRGFSSAPAPSSGPALARAEGQWSDDRYAAARGRTGSQAYLDGARGDFQDAQEPRLAIDPNDERLPAYPGGPLPGEAFPE